jgi:hypothetical protein
MMIGKGEIWEVNNYIKFNDDAVKNKQLVDSTWIHGWRPVHHAVDKLGELIMEEHPEGTSMSFRPRKEKHYSRMQERPRRWRFAGIV